MVEHSHVLPQALPQVLAPHRLDASSVPDVRDRLYAAIDQAEHDVVLELRDVEWIDLTGLGLLVAANARLRARGHQLILHAPRRRLRRILALSGLHRVLLTVCEPTPADRPTLRPCPTLATTPLATNPG